MKTEQYIRTLYKHPQENNREPYTQHPSVTDSTYSIAYIKRMSKTKYWNMTACVL